MHISLFNTVIAIFSLLSSALAEEIPDPSWPDHRFSADPDYCANPVIYNIANHPHKKLLSTYHNVTVVQGGVKNPNCMLAQYNESTSICSMSIIEKASKHLKPAGPKLEAQCPFGVSDEGALAQGFMGTGNYMGGRCWTPEIHLDNM
ncbi:MAG: hypothetical protein Q9191_007606 [Dirinaria sp. TL-2023a]